MGKRLKQCAVCRQRVGFKLDMRDGETKLEQHKMPKGAPCPGSGTAVAQR